MEAIRYDHRTYNFQEDSMRKTRIKESKIRHIEVSDYQLFWTVKNRMRDLHKLSLLNCQEWNQKHTNKLIHVVKANDILKVKYQWSKNSIQLEPQLSGNNACLKHFKRCIDFSICNHSASWSQFSRLSSLPIQRLGIIIKNHSFDDLRKVFLCHKVKHAFPWLASVLVEIYPPGSYHDIGFTERRNLSISLVNLNYVQRIKKIDSGFRQLKMRNGQALEIIYNMGVLFDFDSPSSQSNELLCFKIRSFDFPALFDLISSWQQRGGSYSTFPLSYVLLLSVRVGRLVVSSSSSIFKDYVDTLLREDSYRYESIVYSSVRINSQLTNWARLLVNIDRLSNLCIIQLPSSIMNLSDETLQLFYTGLSKLKIKTFLLTGNYIWRKAFLINDQQILQLIRTLQKISSLRELTIMSKFDFVWTGVHEVFEDRLFNEVSQISSLKKFELKLWLPSEGFPKLRVPLNIINFRKLYFLDEFVWDGQCLRLCNLSLLQIITTNFLKTRLELYPLHFSCEQMTPQFYYYLKRICQMRGNSLFIRLEHHPVLCGKSHSEFCTNYREEDIQKLRRLALLNLAELKIQN